MPARLRRIELITGAERRRKWSAEEKSEIVAESLAEGAVVSEVARRHACLSGKSAVPPSRHASPANDISPLAS